MELRNETKSAYPVFLSLLICLSIAANSTDKSKLPITITYPDYVFKHTVVTREITFAAYRDWINLRENNFPTLEEKEKEYARAKIERFDWREVEHYIVSLLPDETQFANYRNKVSCSVREMDLCGKFVFFRYLIKSFVIYRARNNGTSCCVIKAVCLPQWIK